MVVYTSQAATRLVDSTLQGKNKCTVHTDKTYITKYVVKFCGLNDISLSTDEVLN